jgi:hypothetical protein
MLSNPPKLDNEKFPKLIQTWTRLGNLNLEHIIPNQIGGWAGDLIVFDEYGDMMEKKDVFGGHYQG